MRMLMLVLVLTICSQPMRAQATPKLQITVTGSDSDTQSYDVPARIACVPGQYGPMCAARGAETFSTYTNHISATVIPSGIKISLTCINRKKGDEKHCAPLKPGTYSAERKGNDKLIVYAWQNPLDIGNLSKAHKLEYIVGGDAK